MRNILIISIIVLVILLLILVIFTLLSYIKLKNNKKKVISAFSDVKELLKTRFLLIPLMVEVIKENESGNAEVLKSVIDARNKFNVANTNKQGMEASNLLSEAINKFNLLYREDMKKKSEYNLLVEKLTNNEKELNNIKENYNKEVIKYNKLVNKFPSSIVAKIFKFKNEDVF